MATKNRPITIISALVGLIGLVMIIVGGVAWSMTSTQLADQHMTVAPYSDTHAGKYAGQKIDGPLTAYEQTKVINFHALEATKGKTYAQLDREDPIRNVAFQGSVLRGALFTSVLAFGVSALVMGVGVVLLLVGAALALVVKEPSAEKASRKVAGAAPVTA